MSKDKGVPDTRQRTKAIRRQQLFAKTLFMDVLANLLVCIVAIILLTDPSKRKTSDPAIQLEGKYAVIIQWPDDSADDVDLHVRNPQGVTSYYSSRDTGLMHLEHDDLGKRGDTARNASGEDINVLVNLERTVIRGIVPGEYIVRVHMYDKQDPGPTPVKIRLVRLIGDDKELKLVERTLETNGQMELAFRFTLNIDETASNINELPFTENVDPPPPGAGEEGYEQ